MIKNDAGANPAVTRAAFESIPGPTTIVDIPGGHFGLMWDPSPELDFALATQLSFLPQRLG